MTPDPAMVIYHYNCHSMAFLGGKAEAITYNVYTNKNDDLDKIIVTTILRWLERFNILCPQTNIYSRTICNSPEMHLLVYFMGEDELKVVLPQKYKKFEMVSRFETFYQRCAVSFIHIYESNLLLTGPFRFHCYVPNTKNCIDWLNTNYTISYGLPVNPKLKDRIDALLKNLFMELMWPVREGRYSVFAVYLLILFPILIYIDSCRGISSSHTDKSR